jgi:hypothetical protein
MGKYSTSSRKKVPPKPENPHFIWRGIGCLMMIIIPVISFAAGYETINYGLERGWQIPYQWLGTPRYPDLFYRSDALMTLLSPITNTPNFYAYAITGVVYATLLGGIISVAYAIAYRYVGPPQYGPLDAPRPNIKVKKYKR